QPEPCSRLLRGGPGRLKWGRIDGAGNGDDATVEIAKGCKHAVAQVIGRHDHATSVLGRLLRQRAIAWIGPASSEFGPLTGDDIGYPGLERQMTLQPDMLSVDDMRIEVGDHLVEHAPVGFAIGFKLAICKG